MGLAIEVGFLSNLREQDPDGLEHFRDAFERLNEVLTEAGLPPHHEPEELPLIESRCLLLGYPYSDFARFRRACARAKSDPGWRFPGTTSPEADDAIFEQEASKLKSHLLCHSDCEGYYLPIDFREIIFDESGRVAGAMIGSSYRLMEELISVAPALGICLERGTLSDAEADRINEEIEDEQPSSMERIVWLSLYEAARLSIEHKAAIVFC